MKKIDKRTLILTTIVTLLPILLGLAFYSELPARVAIHWGLKGEENGWASKNFFVFGLPVLMVVLQFICQIGMAMKRNTDEPLPKLYKIVIWIIPILTISLYIVTLAVALGHAIDIRKVVCLILGVLFIITGNYCPKMSYDDRNMINLSFQPKNEHIFRAFTRIMGIAFIGEGILILISLFFPPVVSVIAICLLFCILIGLSFYEKAISKK